MSLGASEVSLAVGCLGTGAAVWAVVGKTKADKRASAETHQREVRKDRLQRTRELYQDIYETLEKMVEKLGRPDGELEVQIRKLGARVAVSASDEVAALYSTAGDAIEKWAYHARLAQPVVSQIGDSRFAVVTFKPGVEQPNEAKATELLPNVVTAFNALKTAMRQELEALDSQVAT